MDSKYQKSVEIAIDYFVERIQFSNTHVPEIVKRIQEKFPDKTKKRKVISEEDICIFKDSLKEKIEERLSYSDTVVLSTDYEPLLLLRTSIEDSGISDKSFFIRHCGFPHKLNMYIHQDSVKLSVSGSNVEIKSK